ncbi:MAG TPA: flippase-like domain-containing protein [Candidatus Binatia bacterium]|nr:flippase-like domain-containing protein [Candidatus Binatia bacterium]
MSEPRVSPESLIHPSSKRWLLFGLVLAVVAIATIVIAVDGSALLHVAQHVRPSFLLFPVLCTAGSYAAMAVSYQRIAAAAGLRLPFVEMVKITLASTALNYVFSTGGLSGLALRSYFFSQKYGLGSGTAVSISLAQTFLTNFVLLAFLFWGLLNLLFDGELRGASETIVAVLFLFSLLLCSAAVAVVASRTARLRVFAFLMRVPEIVSRAFRKRGEAVRVRLALFEEELHEGVDFLIAQGTQMLGPLLYIVMDWFLMLATLYSAFYCVNHPVPMHLVVIGFSTGVFLSIINLVPGGLGIMEGSMAAVFAAFGVPLETAIVATVIFRASYYLLPLVASLLFLRPMLVAGRSRFAHPTAEPQTR